MLGTHEMVTGGDDTTVSKRISELAESFGPPSISPAEPTGYCKFAGRQIPPSWPWNIISLLCDENVSDVVYMFIDAKRTT